MRDVRLGQVGVVPQDHHDPLVVCQTPQPPVDLIMLAQRGCRIGHPTAVDNQLTSRDLMPRPAELIVAGADEQSMEPRAKSDRDHADDGGRATRARGSPARRHRPMPTHGGRGLPYRPGARAAPRQDGERLPVPMLRSDNQLAAHATINSVDVPARTSTQTQASTEVVRFHLPPPRPGKRACGPARRRARYGRIGPRPPAGAATERSITQQREPRP